tara:strand:+ start:1304 stop:1732 length:429 start_codon:yes stop_codon:yes gene_type:complete
MDIRRITATDTLPIRFEVLWPHRSIEFCRVDEDETGLHYGVYVDDELVSVASIFTAGRVSRLRKFATKESHQNQGIGSALLTHIIGELKKEDTQEFWCDARESAMEIYKKFGFRSEGDRFYKSDVPYFKMSVRLCSQSNECE